MNNLPFPRKRVFFTHNLPVCLFDGFMEQKISLHRLKGLERRERKKSNDMGDNKIECITKNVRQ